MASRKDMRRADLIVPYIAPAKRQESGDLQSTMSSTLPMAAMFTRNKMIGWTAVIFAIQAWLSELASDEKNDSATPAYLSFAMAVLSLGIGYVPLFMPPPAVTPGAGSGTEAPSAAPLQ